MPVIEWPEGVSLAAWIGSALREMRGDQDLREFYGDGRVNGFRYEAGTRAIAPEKARDLLASKGRRLVVRIEEGEDSGHR